MNHIYATVTGILVILSVVEPITFSGVATVLAFATLDTIINNNK